MDELKCPHTGIRLYRPPAKNPLPDIAPLNNEIQNGKSVVVSDWVFNRCFEFALDVYGSVKEKLESRGQTNQSAVLQQILDGKVAEFGVWSLLGEYLLSVPDVKIYPPTQKSWEPDLRFSNPPHSAVHVKAMSAKQMDHYGLSWTVQSQDQELQSKDTNQYLALALVDNAKVTLVAVVQCSILGTEKLPLRDPKVARLRGHNKRIIYNDDVQKLSESDRFSL